MNFTKDQHSLSILSILFSNKYYRINLKICTCGWNLGIYILIKNLLLKVFGNILCFEEKIIQYLDLQAS